MVVCIGIPIGKITGGRTMLTTERISVMNMENAIRGARNPMNSWGKMDSYYDEDHSYS